MGRVAATTAAVDIIAAKITTAAIPGAAGRHTASTLPTETAVFTAGPGSGSALP
jgi:hypothetical protein